MTPLTTARTKDIKPQDDIRLTRSHSTVFFWGKNTTGMLGGFALLSRLLSRWQCLKRHWGWSEKACNLEEMASKTSKDIFLLLIFLRAMTLCTGRTGSRNWKAKTGPPLFQTVQEDDQRKPPQRMIFVQLMYQFLATGNTDGWCYK